MDWCKSKSNKSNCLREEMPLYNWLERKIRLAELKTPEMHNYESEPKIAINRRESEFNNRRPTYKPNGSRDKSIKSIEDKDRKNNDGTVAENVFHNEENRPTSGLQNNNLISNVNHTLEKSLYYWKENNDNNLIIYDKSPKTEPVKKSNERISKNSSQSNGIEPRMGNEAESIIHDRSRLKGNSVGDNVNNELHNINGGKTDREVSEALSTSSANSLHVTSVCHDTITTSLWETASYGDREFETISKDSISFEPSLQTIPATSVSSSSLNHPSDELKLIVRRGWPNSNFTICHSALSSVSSPKKNQNFIEVLRNETPTKSVEKLVPELLPVGINSDSNTELSKVSTGKEECSSEDRSSIPRKRYKETIEISDENIHDDELDVSSSDRSEIFTKNSNDSMSPIQRASTIGVNSELVHVMNKTDKARNSNRLDETTHESVNFGLTEKRSDFQEYFVSFVNNDNLALKRRKAEETADRIGVTSPFKDESQGKVQQIYNTIGNNESTDMKVGYKPENETIKEFQKLLKEADMGLATRDVKKHLEVCDPLKGLTAECNRDTTDTGAKPAISTREPVDHVDEPTLEPLICIDDENSRDSNHPTRHFTNKDNNAVINLTELTETSSPGKNYPNYNKETEEKVLAGNPYSNFEEYLKTHVSIEEYTKNVTKLNDEIDFLTREARKKEQEYLLIMQMKGKRQEIVEIMKRHKPCPKIANCDDQEKTRELDTDTSEFEEATPITDMKRDSGVNAETTEERETDDSSQTNFSKYSYDLNQKSSERYEMYPRTDSLEVKVTDHNGKVNVPVELTDHSASRSLQRNCSNFINSDNLLKRKEYYLADKGTLESIPGYVSDTTRRMAVNNTVQASIYTPISEALQPKTTISGFSNVGAKRRGRPLGSMNLGYPKYSCDTSYHQAGKLPSPSLMTFTPVYPQTTATVNNTISPTIRYSQNPSISQMDIDMNDRYNGLVDKMVNTNIQPQYAFQNDMHVSNFMNQTLPSQPVERNVYPRIDVAMRSNEIADGYTISGRHCASFNNALYTPMQPYFVNNHDSPLRKRRLTQMPPQNVSMLSPVHHRGRLVPKSPHVHSRRLAPDGISSIQQKSGVAKHNPNNNSTACSVCRRPAGLICSGCRKVRYCSQQCQVLGWKRNHASVCDVQNIVQNLF